MSCGFGLNKLKERQTDPKAAGTGFGSVWLLKAVTVIELQLKCNHTSYLWSKDFIPFQRTVGPSPCTPQAQRTGSTPSPSWPSGILWNLHSFLPPMAPSGCGATLALACFGRERRSSAQRGSTGTAAGSSSSALGGLLWRCSQVKVQRKKVRDKRSRAPRLTSWSVNPVERVSW